MKSGDKAIIKLRPVRVVISTAMPAYDNYYCSKCGRYIRPGTLHGRSRNGQHFCLKCCEPIDE